MKNTVRILLTFILVVTLLTACTKTATDKSAGSSEKQEETGNGQATSQTKTVDPADTETPEDAKTDTDTETPEDAKTDTSTETPESTKTDKPADPVVLGIEAEDATPYNTKDNAVPFGKWVYCQEKNYTSGEYGPFYIRIVRVSRDQAEVNAAIDSYSGIMDFSLTEDQARDIEYGIVEYEIYYEPDYAAPDFGITVQSVRLSATPINSVGFKTEGGMSYIGVGSAYSLNINGSNFHPHPGDTVREQSLFTVLKNYGESDYVFSKPWYDGEIVAEKQRDLFFAAG